MFTSIRHVKVLLNQWLYIVKYFNVVLHGINGEAQKRLCHYVKRALNVERC
jgi:hypothetical protein